VVELERIVHHIERVPEVHTVTVEKIVEVPLIHERIREERVIVEKIIEKLVEVPKVVEV
jgi:Asp-tRNA(Asn)/Glu-tRNA(Gln) amidotransferase C subunit